MNFNFYHAVLDLVKPAFRKCAFNTRDGASLPPCKIKGYRLKQKSSMDLQPEIERIKADARVIQAMLETMNKTSEGRVFCETALEAGKRIMDSCDRVAKRIKPSSPPAAETQAEQGDEEDKELLVVKSRLAGEHVLLFGQHKGKALKDVPSSYLCWILGVKREGREFKNVPMDKHGWILMHHAETITEVKDYLTWRCWACKSTNTRFKFSRLCPDCWHNEI